MKNYWHTARGSTVRGFRNVRDGVHCRWSFAKKLAAHHLSEFWITSKKHPLELALAWVFIQTGISGWMIRDRTILPTYLDVVFSMFAIGSGIFMFGGLIFNGRKWASLLEQVGLILAGAVYISYTIVLVIPVIDMPRGWLSLASGVAVTSGLWVRAHVVDKSREAVLASLTLRTQQEGKEAS
jgi:hypothetical protein